MALNRKCISLSISRLCLSLMTAFMLALPAFAQEVRKSDIVRVLQSLHELPGIKEGYEQSGFDAERTALMLNHTRLMMANRNVANYVADKLIAARLGQPSTTQLGGVVQPLTDRGIAHLPLKEQIYFLQVETTVLRAMTTNNCGRAMKETINPETFSRDNQRVVSRLNTPALAEYLRILRKATITGASRKSPPRISYSTRERVSDRYFAAALARAEKENLMSQLQRSATSMNVLSNKDACRLGLMFVDTAIDFDGAEKRTLMQLFLLGFE